MKIRHRNRIRRPSLAEFIRRGPFGYITTVYTNEHGNKVTDRRRLKRSDMSVFLNGAFTIHDIPADKEVEIVFGEQLGPLVHGYTGVAT